VVERHIRGLDSLRFVAALWVALSHGGGLPFRPLTQGGGWFGHIIAAGNGVLFNGVAAVIVFFLISGFCIHIPWATAHRLNILSHLTRRYIRIGGPLIGCYIIIYLSNAEVGAAVYAVLWSIYCEIIYYTIYPLIFYLSRQLGIRTLVFVATIISGSIIVSHWSYLYPWEFGIQLTWLVGLPSWLLGCLLAEQATHQKLAATRRIWVWRGSALIYTSAAVVAVFHSPITLGYPATMLIFSFYCYFWLQYELTVYLNTKPSVVLEWGGTWSYSMYLIHNIVIVSFAQPHFPLPYLAGWALQLLAIFLASYAFYLAVEYPCHLLARRLGQAASRAVPAAI